MSTLGSHPNVRVINLSAAENPGLAYRGTSPDFSYRVGFRAAVTRLASKPMKRVVVVG